MAASFGLGYREARGHAAIAAVIGWAVIAVFLLGGSGARSLFGPLKWSDFVHFYTIGDIARTNRVSLLYDGVAQHAHQVALLPESDADLHPFPPYPPQTALFFSPFSALPFMLAGLSWGALTLVVYGLCTWLAWKPSAAAIPDWLFVGLGALASPAVWFLVAGGQSTAIAIAAFVGAWLALERRRGMLAGMCLGLLAFKPQLALASAVILLTTGQWAVISGAACSVAAQLLMVWLSLGLGVIRTYVTDVVPRLPGAAALLEPTPYALHSIAGMTRTLPRAIGVPLLFAVSLYVLILTWRLWRRSHSWRLKMGALVLASILISPHVYLYDLTLVTCAALWLGGTLQEERQPTRWFWTAIYFIAVTCLVPTARWIPGVQATVILMGYVLFRVSRRPTATFA